MDFMNQNMNKPDVNITCPECGTAIDVDEILYHQLEHDIKKKYRTELTNYKKKIELRESEIKSRAEELNIKEKSISDQVKTSVQIKLGEERNVLIQKIKNTLEKENEDRYKSLHNELVDKSEKLREFNKAKSEIEKLKREKLGLREEIELENQKKITDLLTKEREKIAKNEAEKNELKIYEREKIIKQLKQQLTEAQRKAEQGSMQLQGEVQELKIEDWLKSKFPLDEIMEIKKGQRGADCLQTVNTREIQKCGTIYYESKRTKEFQPIWIEKFKSDMRDRTANLGVLVTDALPKNMERMGLIDGIWICNFQEFKGLCFVLRENVIAISNAISTQENKGEKMVMLYDFLTSNEFRLQIEAIVDGFTQMQNDLLSEKRSIQGHWKKREKQIQKVLLNTNFMYSSIKGIAGNAIQSIPQLEFSDANEELNEHNSVDFDQL